VQQNKRSEIQLEENEIKAGQIVRFFESRALAKVLEIDREYSAARCVLMDGVGGECWQRLDLLEAVECENSRKRNVGAD
jgi:streptogramin lyase